LQFHHAFVLNLRLKMRAGQTDSSTREDVRTVRAEPKLDIEEWALGSNALRAVVDDCIVPLLLDRFLRERLALHDSIRNEHNEAHL
jgi:hypothetical protein